MYVPLTCFYCTYVLRVSLFKDFACICIAHVHEIVIELHVSCSLWKLQQLLSINCRSRGNYWQWVTLLNWSDFLLQELNSYGESNNLGGVMPPGLPFPLLWACPMLWILRRISLDVYILDTLVHQFSFSYWSISSYMYPNYIQTIGINVYVYVCVSKYMHKYVCNINSIRDGNHLYGMNICHVNCIFTLYRMWNFS